MKPLPSETFLFDQQRTGRMPFRKGTNGCPDVVWRRRLPNHPPKGAESSPVFDRSGNLYFGCHDGAFYSLNPRGDFRWNFVGEGKVYSSPAIFNHERIVVASGDGHLLCFDCDGNLSWAKNLCDYFGTIANRFRRRWATLHTDYHSYDRARKKRWDAKCWASPCVTEEGIVYISALGIGLHAINIEDGSARWTYDLGCPRHHLSGVALDDKGDIYVASQQRHFHRVTRDGQRVWTYDTRCKDDAWGNPSIDLEEETVYFTLASSRLCRGQVVALGLDGCLKWRQILADEVRGSVAIGYGEYVVVGDFKGFLYFLSKKTGAQIKVVRLSEAQRALWTTPSIDPDGHILITTKDSPHSGSLYCLQPDGAIAWRHEVGKALSTPVIDYNGRVYIGSWTGEYLCLQT